MFKMLKEMNLPNKLTLLRMVLVPIFIVFMALPTDLKWPLYVALAVFIIAAITDRLDGKIARKHNLITTFGKIMDPLADKLIVSAGFIMLVGLGVIPGWMVAVIIARDFFVNGLRMFGADNQKDLAAGLSGKIKTVFQMIAIPFAIVGVAINAKYSAFGIFFAKSMLMSTFELFVNIFMTISMAAVLLSTVWSFVDYIIRFKDDIVEEKKDDEIESTEEVVEDEQNNENNESEVKEEVVKEENVTNEEEITTEIKEEKNQANNNSSNKNKNKKKKKNK